MEKLKPLPRLLLGATLSLLGCPPATLAQQGPDAPIAAATPPSQSPVVTLSPREASDFQQALQGIAAQGRLTVVAEDAPLHPRLRGKIAIPSVPTPAPELLAKVADAYDYDLSRAGSVFLLQKRYSDPRDLPAVTPEECAFALQQIDDILAAYDPARGDASPSFCGRMATMFISSLSPAQAQALQSSAAATGLSVASLSETQQEMIRQFAGALYLDGASDKLPWALDYLSQTPQITVRVQRSHRTFSTSTTENERVITETWNQDAVPGFDATEPPFPGDNGIDAVPKAQFHSFDDRPPAPSDPAPPREPRPEPGDGAEGYTTLAGVVAGLTAHGGKFAVAAPYRAKPVSVYGVADAGPNDLFAALALVYGLRVGTDENARKVLTAPILVPPDGFDAVPGALHAALPDSLRRAAHDGRLDRKREAILIAKQQAFHKAEQEARTPADIAVLGVMQRNLPNWGMDVVRRPGRMHTEAVNRLHDAIDAHLAAQGTSERAALMQAAFTPEIKLSALPASAQSDFAITQMTDTLERLNHTVGTSVPPWVADVDHAFLVGSSQPDPNLPGMVFYSLGISYPSENGTLGMTASSGTGPMRPITSPSGSQ